MPNSGVRSVAARCACKPGDRRVRDLVAGTATRPRVELTTSYPSVCGLVVHAEAERGGLEVHGRPFSRFGRRRYGPNAVRETQTVAPDRSRAAGLPSAFPPFRSLSVGRFSLASPRIPLAQETRMTMPSDVGVIHLMIAPPFRARADLPVPAPEPPGPGVARRVRVPRPVHVQERPHPEAGDDPVRSSSSRWTGSGSKGHARRLVREDGSARFVRAMNDIPIASSGASMSTRTVDGRGTRPFRAVEELGVKAATAFPAGLYPQVPINDAKFYPLYAKCIELDIPICVCAGVPGPRVPFAPQYVGLIDEVCWYFPELKFVTRHGCEPWADLAVKLLLKWPNLYYSTSGSRPATTPEAVVDFAKRVAPTRSCTPATTRWACRWTASSMNARRSVPRQRVAEVPARKRRTGLQAVVTGAARKSRPAGAGIAPSTPRAPSRSRGRWPSRKPASRMGMSIICMIYDAFAHLPLFGLGDLGFMPL